METILHNGVTIAVIQEDQLIIHDVQDALDLMAEARYLGSDCLILAAENLDPAFFDLKTKLAGEILQKFSNYRMRLAIVGNFSGFQSKSLKDFIKESNRTGRIIFVSSADEARQLLSGK